MNPSLPTHLSRAPAHPVGAGTPLSARVVLTTACVSVAAFGSTNEEAEEEAAATAAARTGE